MAIRRETEKTKVVIFLGSGFSAVLGLPTTSQLSERLLSEAHGDKTLDEFITVRIDEFWRRVFGWKDGMRPPSMEDHFTEIDLAANSGHHLGTKYGPKELRALRRMTIHRIFSLLKSPGVQVASAIQFFKSVSEYFDVTLVTTNWDCEAESYLDLLQLTFNYGLDEITQTGRQPPAKGLPVLKLHGCTNRGYCDCCRSIIRFEGIEEAVVRLHLLLKEEDFRLFEGSERAVEVLRRLKMAHGAHTAARACPDCGVGISLRVGTFSYRKDLSPHAFYTVWDKAQTGLQLARKWLFVGYSLPEADIEIRHLLKSAQLARKNPAEVSIKVVLKGDGEAGDRFKRFFGLPDQYVFQCGLEQWVAQHLNSYCQ
jgi:hypothetical protein